MNRLAAVLTALTVTACSATPGPVTAQDPAPADAPRTLQVSATATVRRAPDQATIQLAVETHAATADEASEANAATMDRVLAAVRDQGVDPSMIRTRRLELQPRYERRREEEPAIIGYRAVNQVSVELDDVARVGAVVDAAVRAGANRVTGIDFGLSDPQAAYDEALREAIAKARAEAEVAASALDETLGPPLQVSTGGFSPPMPMFRAEAVAMDQAGAPPVQPGEVEVRATVNITWRLGT